MDVNNISTSAGKDGALPCIAQSVRILLVDHDTTSLMALASRFEQQLYKVTTTESAIVALSLFGAQKNYYDIVIADLHMPEIDIYEFVKKVLHQRMNTPIILIAEDSTMDSASQALGNGVCYLFSKPPSHRDIATVWQHICRVTGKMPSLTDKNYIDVEKYGNPIGGSSSDGAARNQTQSNLRRNIINTDRKNMKKRKNQIAEDSDSSNDTNEDDGRNSKKSRMTWTCALHEKFLQAVDILEEHGRVQPLPLLRMMNEPGLTHRHVSSHLQKYRDRKRRSNNLQKMPVVLPAAPLNNFVQGQTSGTANLNCMEARSTSKIPSCPGWQKAPNFVPYNFDGVKQNQDPFNYPGKDSVNTFINNGGVQIPQGIHQNHNRNETPGANIGEQAQVFNQTFNDHAIPASSHPSNGLQVPNQEIVGASIDLIPQSDHWSNGLQAPNQKPAGASGPLSNGFQALNQEPAGDFETGLYGFGNAGNLGNMNNDNFGEGTSGSNQQFDGMSSNDDINQIIQEFEASGVNLWDLIN